VSCPKKDSYWWGLRQSMRHEISTVVIDEVGSIPALATAVPTVMNWGRPEWARSTAPPTYGGLRYPINPPTYQIG